MTELPEMAQALLHPEAYPDTSAGVELVQTQTSFIFLTGDFVYKVKKPVNLDYLDYTTLEKRQFYCQREVELNRRLCPDAYLGIVTINQNKADIKIEGRGGVIEYAVKMRYLPREAMLDMLLAGDKVSVGMITALAEKMTRFHREAETSPAISFFGENDAIITSTEDNFNQTIQFIGNTISQKSYRRIKDFTSAFIEANAYIFHQRVANGKIRDCHGDFHSAHICFDDDIYIFGCVEFNDRFRYCDVASEIAFLAMDLDKFGRADLSRAFVDAYKATSQDEELSHLLNFYKCYRAYTCGKAENNKLDNPHISEEEKAQIQEVANKYYELAESYTE